MARANIFTIPNAHKENANAVLYILYGRGPDNFTQKAKPTGQVPDTASHWYMNDSSLSVEMAQTIADISGPGNLPTLPEGFAWGVDGLPSQGDATSALAAMKIFRGDGEIDAITYRDALFAGNPVHTGGLVPFGDVEI